MSFQITEAFVSDFTAGFTLRVQQLISRIQPYVMVDSGVKGTEKDYDFIGKRTPQQRTDRHGDTIRSDTPHDRRWVDLVVYDDADLIDKPDLVRTLTDPTNVYSESMEAGFARKIDEIIMDAAIGTARTGQDGTDSEVLPATSILNAPATTTALTVPLVINTLQLLNANEHSRKRHFAYTAEQEAGFMQEGDVKSSDFNIVKAQARGDVRHYAGFDFHRVEDPILKKVGDDRQCVAWDEACLQLAFGANIQGSIDRLPTKRNSVQVFYSMDLGAVRLDDTGVVKVWADEV